MKRLLLILSLALAAVLIAGCGGARTLKPQAYVSESGKMVTLPDGVTKLPLGVKFIRNVQYGVGGEEALYLDILCPIDTPDGSMPVVIAIHGGGGVAGSKSDSYGILPQLVLNGYFCVAIDYRLAPGAVFPAQIEDCKCAVRFLRAMKDEYHIDERKIGVWGVSAGGYLAAMLGTTGGFAELEGSGGWADHSSGVQAVVDWYGRADLAIEALPANHSASVMLGTRPQDDPELAKKASPVTYASADDPPFLIMHGDQDAQVPLSHSRALEVALREKGVEAAFLVIEGAGHDFSMVEDRYQSVLDFLNKNLK